MAIKSALWRISGAVALISLSTTPALAGGPCGGIPCDLGTVAQPSLPADQGPVTISSHTPYDYFDTVHFQRAPHVSITRVHSLPPTVALSDAPVGFTKGCNPNSTVYCRQSAKPASAKPAYRPIQPPAAPRPVIRQPISHAPIVHRPAQPSRVVAVGRGYDASKFTPRVYGDPYTITPGTAHVPTSIVDRDPYRAQAVLDSGPGGITPALLGVPIRPYIPPRLPIGYPAPYVASTSAQGQQALQSVTVRPGYVSTGPGTIGGPLIHPQPPVYPAPAPTVCRSGGVQSHGPVGRYPTPGYTPVPTGGCQAGRPVKSRY